MATDPDKLQDLFILSSSRVLGILEEPLGATGNAARGLIFLKPKNGTRPSLKQHFRLTFEFQN